MASPPGPGVQRNESRSSSLSSRLFRTKSGEALGSGSRLRKGRQDSLPQAQSQTPVSPPKLPEYSIQPQLGISPRMTSKDYTSNGAPPVPPIPSQIAEKKKKEVIDPYARTESMTHRGRYSYAPSTSSTLNSPRRVRRRKDPTPFNILVIGARSSGKTSFINFLKHSLALPARKQPPQRSELDTPPPSNRNNRDFIHSYQEIEVDHERLGLTLWDSQGLDKGVVDLQLRELTNFVESKFDDTFLEEVKVVRSHVAFDTHIHCVFLILDPARLNQNLKAAEKGNSNGAASRIGKVSRIIGALDEDFDLQVIRALQGKTVVIPVISKADTVTTQHMAFLKKKVHESLKRAGLDPLEVLNYDEEDDMIEEGDEDEENVEKSSDDDSTPASPASAHTEDSDTVPVPAAPKPQHKREPSNMSMSNSFMDSGYLPLSVLSPDEYSLESGDSRVGRQFPWGFADPYNIDHCDFIKLKDAVFSEWRSELREASRERFYEAWRTQRLHRQGQKPAAVSAPRKSTGGIPIPLEQRTKV